MDDDNDNDNDSDNNISAFRSKKRREKWRELALAIPLLATGKSGFWVELGSADALCNK